MSSQRTKSINEWLAKIFVGLPVEIEPLKGDASFRQYFRLKTQSNTYILMDAPPEKEPIGPYIDCTNRLAHLGVNVPVIHHQNLELGALVLTDFGRTDYQSALNSENCLPLYQDAIESLIKIQSDPNTSSLVTFDEAHVRTELALFDTWYLQKHLNYESTAHQSEYDYLIEAIQSQPFVSIHRDYHSRNLMLTDEENPGVIDHQDMMAGPLAYDLVSLLRDCYIDWPEEVIDQLITYYQSHSNHQLDDFKRHFDLTGVQRHLKAIGIFARLAYLYDNSSYLKYIPRTLKYIQGVADRDNKLRKLAELTKIVP